MYEELVARLRYKAGFDTSYDSIYDEAAVAIEELNLIAESNERSAARWAETAGKAVEQIPRWIPVVERLPDCFYGEEIGNIEWISHGTVYAGCFGRGGKFRDAYFRVWNDATEGIDAINAEYWRFVLLPEPPKEET